MCIRDSSWNNLAARHHCHRDEDLHHRHQTFKPLASKPAQAKLIRKHDATGAEQRLRRGGNRVRDRKEPAAVFCSHADEESGEIEAAGKPERNVDENADPRTQQRTRRYRSMQQNIRLLLVEKHLTRRGGDRHSEKDERHAVQIQREREHRLSLKSERAGPDCRIKEKCEPELRAHGLWSTLLLQAARSATAQKERQKQM